MFLLIKIPGNITPTNTTSGSKVIEMSIKNP